MSTAVLDDNPPRSRPTDLPMLAASRDASARVCASASEVAVPVLVGVGRGRTTRLVLILNLPASAFVGMSPFRTVFVGSLNGSAFWTRSGAAGGGRTAGAGGAGEGGAGSGGRAFGLPPPETAASTSVDGTKSITGRLSGLLFDDRNAGPTSKIPTSSR